MERELNNLWLGLQGWCEKVEGEEMAFCAGASGVVDAEAGGGGVSGSLESVAMFGVLHWRRRKYCVMVVVGKGEFFGGSGVHVGDQRPRSGASAEHKSG